MIALNNRKDSDCLIGSFLLLLSGIVSIADGYYVFFHPDYLSALSQPWQQSIDSMVSTPFIGGLCMLILTSPSFMVIMGIVFISIGVAWLVSGK